MGSKIFGNLSKWQNYVHYGLLTFGLILGLDFFGIASISDPIEIIILYILIFVVDTIVHLFFHSAPKPIQWRD